MIHSELLCLRLRDYDHYLLHKQMSSIHYKFASTLGTADFNTVSFDGSFIKLLDLKQAIIEQKKLRLTPGELRVTNAQTGEGWFLRSPCY